MIDIYLEVQKFCGRLQTDLSRLHPERTWIVTPTDSGPGVSAWGNLPYQFFILAAHSEKGGLKSFVGLQCAGEDYDQVENKTDWLHQTARRLIAAN